MPELLDPFQLVRPRRSITGMSAILLPFDDSGRVDWPSFVRHVARTAAAGLAPAVNMDTGFVNLLDDDTRRQVLQETRSTLGPGPRFVAGAFVSDRPGDPFDAPAYRRQIEMIEEFGGVPVLFQSFGLTKQSPAKIVASYVELGQYCREFIGFELGTMFAPFGKIYDLDTYAGLLQIPNCLGAKHSSLSRELEWQRLQLRDRQRPDFRVFTGNDLAIDMVMYGSDYLLGLSTMAPDLFARRDALWLTGDPQFHELNDLLQYLGCLTFRAPVPAYKHSAAQVLKLRGWITCDHTHPRSGTRPASDVPILQDIVDRMQAWL